MTSISISPKRFATILISVIPLMLILQVALRIIQWVMEQRFNSSLLILKFLVQRFDFNRELSVPTWYSSSLLFIGGTLFAVIAIAKVRDKYALHWRGLAILFLYLSIDEASSLHELTISPLRNLLKLDGFLYYSWVVIAIPVVFILCLIYLKFFTALPQQTRRLWILSIGLYVAGGIGVELIGGYVANLQDVSFLVEFITTTTEEVLEMLGVNILIYTLLTYITREIGNVHLLFQPSSNKQRSLV